MGQSPKQLFCAELKYDSAWFLTSRTWSTNISGCFFPHELIFSLIFRKITGNKKKTQHTALPNVVQCFNAKLFNSLDLVIKCGILSCLKSGKLDSYLFMPCSVVQVMWTWWTGCSWMLASPPSWSRPGKRMNCSKWSAEKKKKKKSPSEVNYLVLKSGRRWFKVFLRHLYLSCHIKSTFQFGGFFSASSLYLLCLSGPLSWPDLLPPTEGSQGSTPKGTCRAGLQERGGAWFRSVGRSGQYVWDYRIKNNDVVCWESRGEPYGDVPSAFYETSPRASARPHRVIHGASRLDHGLLSPYIQPLFTG